MNKNQNSFTKFVISLIGSALLFIAALTLFAFLQTASAQIGSGASDPRTPTFRTVTVQPARGSPGTGAFIVYDKFGTQYFRVNPTNLTFDLLISGTTYTPTNALTQKFLSGTGVTNVMVIRNGFIVGVTNVP